MGTRALARDSRVARTNQRRRHGSRARFAAVTCAVAIATTVALLPTALLPEAAAVGTPRSETEVTEFVSRAVAYARKGDQIVRRTFRLER